VLVANIGWNFVEEAISDFLSLGRVRRRILGVGVGEKHGAKEVTYFATSHQTIFGKLIKNSQRSSMNWPAEGHGRRNFKNGGYFETKTIVISLRPKEPLEQHFGGNFSPKVAEEDAEGIRNFIWGCEVFRLIGRRHRGTLSLLADLVNGLGLESRQGYS
jgi:hypothetical protein